jgi:hypothetical protein
VTSERWKASHAIGSSAYGPEAALSTLVAAGLAGLGDFKPIMLAIIVLQDSFFSPTGRR